MPTKSRRLIDTIVCAAMLCGALLSGAAHAHEPVDKTRLPVGDGKHSSSPRQGYVWTCSSRFGGGGP